MNNISMEKYYQLPFRQPPCSVGQVFGEDKRTQVTDTSREPYNAVAYLIIIVNGIAYRGTGFMVKPGVLITAGHNVYDHDAKKFCDKAYVLDRKSLDRYELYNIIIDEHFKIDNSSTYDWAVASVSVAPGKDVPCLRMQRMDMPNSPDATKHTAEIPGFPSSVRNVSTNEMYTESGMILNYNNDTHTLRYQIDTSGGNSGSPILLYVGETPYAAGIHTAALGGCNIGRAIDQGIADAVTKL